VGSGVKVGVGSGVKVGVGSGVKVGVGSGVKAGVGSGVKAGVGSGVKAGVGSGVKVGVGFGVLGRLSTGVYVTVPSVPGSGTPVPELATDSLYASETYITDPTSGEYESAPLSVPLKAFPFSGLADPLPEVSVFKAIGVYPVSIASPETLPASALRRAVLTVSLTVLPIGLCPPLKNPGAITRMNAMMTAPATRPIFLPLCVIYPDHISATLF